MRVLKKTILEKKFYIANLLKHLSKKILNFVISTINWLGFGDCDILLLNKKIFN